VDPLAAYVFAVTDSSRTPAKDDRVFGQLRGRLELVAQAGTYLRTLSLSHVAFPLWFFVVLQSLYLFLSARKGQ